MKHLINLLKSRQAKAENMELWSIVDGSRRDAITKEIDEIILDLKIIEQAEDKLSDFKIEDGVNEIRVPVMKPNAISVEVKNMTASSEMFRPYWVVHFERSVSDRNKWNFKRLDNE